MQYPIDWLKYNANPLNGNPNYEPFAAILAEREETLATVNAIAQAVHQGYHDFGGTFLECPKYACSAARQLIQKARAV
ncbi:MAG: hypothetical protein UMS36scaffold28_72 [Phage 59_13]|nr:MAG: hypothetical protein UMS36scaffold28_72 [Phage 59_13]